MVYRTKEHKERLNNIDNTMTRREKIGYYALLDNNKKLYLGKSINVSGYNKMNNQKCAVLSVRWLDYDIAGRQYLSNKCYQEQFEIFD